MVLVFRTKSYCAHPFGNRHLSKKSWRKIIFSRVTISALNPVC